MAEDGEHPRLIAHAGGAIYGYRLTNSLEALDRAWEGGFRFIELDFERSSDGEIVLIHDWEAMAERLLGAEGQRRKADFLAADALAGLTLLDLAGLLDWLGAHPGCQIITDADLSMPEPTPVPPGTETPVPLIPEYPEPIPVGAPEG